MKQTLKSTNLKLKGLQKVYKGKVRDVYFLEKELIAMVASDRISAFDVVLPKGIPFKGQVLNEIAALQLDATSDIVPNWKIASPHPMLTIGHHCEPFKVEMVIRGYITGSAWRAYEKGERVLCGIELPEGLKENQAFAQPIITPTTKEDEGHDENISREEIIRSGLVSEEDYKQLETYTYQLFARGTELAKERGLILVDTKYEFGKKDGKIYLIDEIHTPDSSRYFYADGFEERLAKGEPQRQLSKEFVRHWLIENGFSGKTGEQIPEMTEAYCQGVSQRYIELYEKFTGRTFSPCSTEHLEADIESSINEFLESYKGNL